MVIRITKKYLLYKKLLSCFCSAWQDSQNSRELENCKYQLPFDYRPWFCCHARRCGCNRCSYGSRIKNVDSGTNSFRNNFYCIIYSPILHVTPSHPPNPLLHSPRRTVIVACGKREFLYRYVGNRQGQENKSQCCCGDMPICFLREPHMMSK